MTSEERHKARYLRRKAARAAKRHLELDKYNDFDYVSSPMSLMRAHFDAERGVTFKGNVARYNAHYFKNSFLLSNALRAGKNIHKGYYRFTIYERGKKREIHSLHYPERVVRRSFCINSLVPVLSHNLIYDNGASLKGKGVSFAVDRCKTHLRRWYCRNGTNGYVIIIDFKGYFDHIIHSKLFDIIDNSFYNDRIKDLAKNFIRSADESKPVYAKGVGLFIGPEDSQIFAVAYPNAIDHTIKDKWRIKEYGRYMDDSYILVKDKESAKKILSSLSQLYQIYGIIPNARKTQIVKLSHGFTFLKNRFSITNTGRVIRRADHKSTVRERRKLKKLHGIYNTGKISLTQICQQYMSWRGFMIRKNAYKTLNNMDALFQSLFMVKPWRCDSGKGKINYGRSERGNFRYRGRDKRDEVSACKQ